MNLPREFDFKLPIGDGDGVMVCTDAQERETSRVAGVAATRETAIQLDLMKLPMSGEEIKPEVAATPRTCSHFRTLLLGRREAYQY